MNDTDGQHDTPADQHTPIETSSTMLTCRNTGDSQRFGGASCITRATVGGLGELDPATGAAGVGPAWAPDGIVGDPAIASSAALPERATSVPQPADAQHPADDETAADHREHDQTAADQRPDGRVPTAVFLQDAYAALDAPPFPADNPGSVPMPPTRLRPRGKEPRGHYSIRLTATEVRLIEDAVTERCAPNFSGFIADAAVAVATNQFLALLPHERAVRAIGQEMGRTLWHLGKVGVNLNQIARQLNTGDTAAAARVEQTLDLLDALLAQLRAVNIHLAEAVGGS